MALPTTLVVIDFETYGIGSRPDEYPPVPVGYAYRLPDGTARYTAWGHPTKNNCSRDTAWQHLCWLATEFDGFICHNWPFDAAVAAERMGQSLTGQVHDTMALAFLEYPYSTSFSLKPLAEKHLGMSPEEQDAVAAWLIEHQPVAGTKITKKNFGAYIAFAPGDLVGAYAIGDVERTWRLFEKLYPQVEAHSMLDAYHREMRVLLITVAAEHRGVPVNADLICEDGLRFEQMITDCEQRIRGALKFDGNLDSGDDLAVAVERTFGVTLPKTATGRSQTNKAALEAAITDPHVLADLRYHAALSYDLSTYMGPLVEASQRNGGWVHPQWNSTRQADDWKRGGGARSGRFSSSPNFQNLRDPENHLALLHKLQKMNPAAAYDLPVIRRYIEAPEGMVLFGRDYSQIELRITAHYEDGPMAEHYRADPTWDLHQFVIDRVQTMFGKTLSRRLAKNIGFGVIYGAGGGAISDQAGIPYDEAVEFKQMYLEALPSLRGLMQEVQTRGRNAGFVTTLGGRRYYAEPPRVINDVKRTFEYKLLNYLIQPSAADLIKQAMVDWGSDHFIMTVHDELVGLCDSGQAGVQMERLRVAMDENKLVKALDVPVFSEGYVGANWAETMEVMR